MAHQTRLPANRFAHSSDLKNNRGNAEHFHHSEFQQSTIPLLDQTTEIGDNSVHSIPVDNSQEPLRMHVERVVREYFAALGDELPTDLYALILKEVELPLLTVILEQTRGNQTKCAQILGLNRGTLRKKLKTYNLMS